MITILCCLWLGIGLGYFFKCGVVARLGAAVTPCVWLLLLLMGVEVGGNEQLLAQLDVVCMQALVLAVATSVCCAVLSLLLWRLVSGGLHEASGAKAVVRAASWGDGLLYVGLFLLGAIGGYIMGQVPHVAQVTFIALCALLLVVGVSLGSNPTLLRGVKQLSLRLLFLPFVTMGGTWLGVLAVSFCLHEYTSMQCVAVGSGFGYYSLSSVLIARLCTPQLGVLALVYNLLREMIVFALAPFIVRWCGPLSIISIGGATTADTTLPIIRQVSGERFVPLSIYHGVVMDFSVPFLVTLFCSI